MLEPGHFRIKPLLVTVFKDGECVYESPGVDEIRSLREKELDSIWEESKRLLNPHEVHVDLSQELYDLKQELLKNHSKKEFLH